MNGLETAIRTALAKITNPTKEQREKVYTAARTALNNGLLKQNISDPETVLVQRRRLEILIQSVEMDYPSQDLPETSAPSVAPNLPAVELERTQAPAPVVEALTSTPEVEAPSAHHEARTPVTPEVAMEPRIAQPDKIQNERTRAPFVAQEPRLHDVNHDEFIEPSVEETTWNGQEKFQTAKNKLTGLLPQKRPVFSLILVVALLVAFVGMGIWGAFTTGLFESAENRDTSVPNPPPTVDSENYEGRGVVTVKNNSDSTFNEKWIEAFTPADVSSIATRGNSSVKLINSEETPYVRIRSRTPDQNGEILITVGTGVLREMAGKQVSIAVTMRAANNQKTQVYIKCEFSTLGDCGRRRFNLSYEKSDVVFNVDFTNARRTNSAGYLVINTDINGKGNAVDLYAIRILVEN